MQELSENKTMLSSIKKYADNGGQIIAECGGMMYLGKSIIDKAGEEFEMVNVFDFKTTMANMKLTLGYRTIQFSDFNLKGHEFHYSLLIDDAENKSEVSVFNAREKEVETKVFRYKNVIASYIHYYLGKPQLLRKLLNTLSN
jgi:cobyrinic acid a,c-diamide synthase